MKLYKKPLFDEKQGEIFIGCIDDDMYKKIAWLIFVEGKTNEETAEIVNYSVRQIERIRQDITRTALKKLVEKQTSATEV